MEAQSAPMQPQLRKYFYQKAAAMRTPISGTFELTPLCNMNCRMCYIRMSPEEMRQRGQQISADDWIEMGRACAQQGMLFLLITGGEPFLHKDFRRIYTELKKLGLMIAINSNATLIDEQTVAWLREDPPVKINVTLYGGSNDTYARLCGYPTGFDAATRAVDMLLEAGIMVNINSSFTKWNVEDMAAIIEFGKSRGIQVNSATYMFPPVRSAKDGKTDDAVRFTPEEAGLARAQAELLTLPPEQLERRLRSLHEGHFDSGGQDEDCERTADEQMGCMAGKASFWITWDGRMTPCGMLNQPVVRPFEIGFAEAWRLIHQQTDQIFMPAACTNCKMRAACNVCGALCIAESGGRSDIKPEYLCRQTQAFLAEMEKAYQERFGGGP